MGRSKRLELAAWLSSYNNFFDVCRLV